jgi:adenosylhomocysteine nucleosidase
VIRAVCDAAERDLPPAALAALDAHGAIGLSRLIGSIIRSPRQLPALFRLAGDAKAAHHTLAACTRRIIQELGAPTCVG